jgi:hypothetical protein
MDISKISNSQGSTGEHPAKERKMKKITIIIDCYWKWIAQINSYRVMFNQKPIVQVVHKGIITFTPYYEEQSK